MIRKITICCVIIGFIGAKVAHGQDLKYFIYRGDDHIGEILVSKKMNGTEEKININSVATFKVLWSTHNRTSDFEVIYKNGILYYSLMETILNDELEKKAETKRQNGVYTCLEYPDHKHTISQDIHFSSAQLYYEEPVGIHKVYAESYLALCSIEKYDADTYKLTLPGNKHNYYTYKDGKLIEVLVDRTWFDITFKRQS